MKPRTECSLACLVIVLSLLKSMLHYAVYLSSLVMRKFQVMNLVIAFLYCTPGLLFFFVGTHHCRLVRESIYRPFGNSSRKGTQNWKRKVRRRCFHNHNWGIYCSKWACNPRRNLTSFRTKLFENVWYCYWRPRQTR